MVYLHDPATYDPIQTLRTERNARLAASDWVILRNLETNEPIPQAWLDYRQALRDLPETIDPQWPEAPST